MNWRRGSLVLIVAGVALAVGWYGRPEVADYAPLVTGIAGLFLVTWDSRDSLRPDGLLGIAIAGSSLFALGPSTVYTATAMFVALLIFTSWWVVRARQPQSENGGVRGGQAHYVSENKEPNEQ